MRKWLRRLPLLLPALLLCHYFYPGQTNQTSDRASKTLLAHRGAHTNWQKGVYDARTGCEARHIFTPPHQYIENTLASVQAAINWGADIVEVDIRPSADGHLMIYHDSDLSCRTDGSGHVHEQPLAYLKSLDIGFAYTADGGRTYPFRHHGIGLMPTLSELLEAFPNQRFLIDHKDGQVSTMHLLAAKLALLPAEKRRLLSYWGPVRTLDTLQTAIPEIDRLILNRGMMKQWFKHYILTLGLGHFPEFCRGRVIGLPPQYTRFLFGWPHRFMDKVHREGARFYLLIDTAEDAEKYKDYPVDGFITDYIEVTGPILKPGPAVPHP